MQEDDELYRVFNSIESRSDFEIFLKKLIENFVEKKEVWDNDTLENYLDALYGYNYESENSEPSWKLFAEMLLAARIYE